jgi:hypothetical protein
MDVSVALRRVENVLRDTFQDVLSKSIGPDWVSKCGVSEDRLTKWKERAHEDEKKKKFSDPRIIYYADFYDLRTIAKKCWGNGLLEIFEDTKELDVFLCILEGLRNPEAHRREFLPFEIHLAEGIAGKLRSKVTRYYSRMQTHESYYPRFEYAQDSIGNAYSIGQGKSIASQGSLRPGDQLQFKLVANDPLGEEVEYLVYPNAGSAVAKLMAKDQNWSSTGDFSFEIVDEHVGKQFIFIAIVKSNRSYHADKHPVLGGIDDQISFVYEILPPRSE